MTDAATLAGALPAYEIGSELGRGGFGIVMAGRHRQLGRLVAIKELPPQLAADAGVRARFVTEARVLASLDHPHIVPVYDYVEQDGLCLLVMESLPGGTVWDAFQQSGYTPHMACAVVMVSCAGLHYAHQHGVLHRDVKPENLLFTQSGQLKVADFGIAKVVGGKDALATSAGEILGTPAYMAPEQAEGKDLGPESDVFAAGVMLYELLSGALPYSEEGGGIAIVYRHVYEKPRPLREVAPAVPADVADVVMRALARDPADRYATAEDFGVAIGEAATTAFGLGWLASTQVPVMGGGRILSSTERVSGALTAPGPSQPATSGRETVIGGVPPITGPPAGPANPAAPAPATATGVPLAAPPDPAGVPTQRVRPSTAMRVKVSFGDLSPESLVPVRQVLQVPPWPLPFALLSLALAGLVALLAFIGIGSAATAAGVPAGSVTVAGQDVAAGQPISVDLSAKVPIRVALTQLRAGVAPDSAVLRMSVAGIPLPDSSIAKLAPAGKAASGEIDARGNRYLVTGEVTAELVISGKGSSEVRTIPLTLQLDRPFYTTVPGVALVIALLFLLAYGESMVRPLRRRGRRRISSYVGLVVVGSVLGAVAVAASWVLGMRAPTAATLALCAGVGALAGLALATTATQAGRRARVLRVARKEEVARATGRT